MDQLHMHFTQAIHNTVFQVVLGYVELCAGNADTKFQKMQYKDLCTVRSECVFMCVGGQFLPPDASVKSSNFLVCFVKSS